MNDIIHTNKNKHTINKYLVNMKTIERRGNFEIGGGGGPGYYIGSGQTYPNPPYSRVRQGGGEGQFPSPPSKISGGKCPCHTDLTSSKEIKQVRLVNFLLFSIDWKVEFFLEKFAFYSNYTSYLSIY